MRGITMGGWLFLYAFGILFLAFERYKKMVELKY